MSNIDIKNIKSSEIVTTKDVERAEQKYNTEKYEEDIWAEAVDETNIYVEKYDLQISGVEEIIHGLEAQKTVVSEGIDDLTVDYNKMIEIHDQLEHVDERRLTAEQRHFMDNFDNNKRKTEVQMEEMKFSLEELDNVIKKKENEVSSYENKKVLIEQHRDLRVKPRYEKEVKDADKAYEEWQELKKKQEEQQEYLSDYTL